jgi:ATP-dependent Clp protease ATP-binding subunit ClpC
MLLDFNKRLHEKKIKVDLSLAAKEHFAEIGYDKAYGARPLRRVFQRELEDYLATETLKGSYENPSIISMDYVDDKFIYENKPWEDYKEAGSSLKDEPEQNNGSEPEKEIALV